MTGKHVTVKLEDVETMLGALAEELDRKGTLTTEAVAAADPRPLAEVAAQRPRTLRRRLAEVFTASPLLGWPLTVFLWILLVVNLYAVVAWYYGIFSDYGYYDFTYMPSLASLLASALFSNLLPLARIAAVFALLRCRFWGLIVYVVASLLWMMLQTVQYTDDTTQWLYAREICLLLFLVVLLRPKWHDFD